METVEMLKLSLQSNKLLAELKGYCQTLPNPNLLLNTIVLQESKESNAIENIVTTQDELYKATLQPDDKISNPHAKEVIQYREAMYWGLQQMKLNNLITTNLLVGIMQRLRNTQENIRKNIGTKLTNPTTNEIIYTPPEGENIIRDKMASLEQFINNEDSLIDPLIKMALIHYQFEAIHPFSDGNGRTGRILNVLYFVQQDLIGLPVLYLSRYIIQNKIDYYIFLRGVTDKGDWYQWISFVVKGVGETAAVTLKKIKEILLLKNNSEQLMKRALGSSFTREFADLLFSFPYIKIKVLEENGVAKRQTASVYFQKLTKTGLLKALKIGKESYYINHQLMNILTR